MKTSRALNTLSALYLLSASAFGIAIALQRNPDWAAAAQRAAEVSWPAIQRGAAVANENAVQPALRKLAEADKAFFDAIDPQPAAVATVKLAPKVAKKSVPVVVARQVPHQVQKTIVSPPLRPAIAGTQPTPQIAKVETPKPAMTLVPEQAPVKAATANAPRPDLTAPSPAELARVMLRLKDSLTIEMLQNFELFLYVSKADSGPLAQRMYVFRKQASGDLGLLYNWPVSTGREAIEPEPSGRMADTHTPAGYYELDPKRFYVHHVSGEWLQPMPHAMFFTWKHNGTQTGLAIHGTTEEDVAFLGQRASAGCVRLAPENAALLFNLIRTKYQGLAPRFAYDRSTASMSNDGLMMHDAQGRVKVAEGYKVLVFIENYGGDNVMAAVF